MKISTEQKLRMVKLGDQVNAQRDALIAVATDLQREAGTKGAQKSLARIIADLGAWRDKHASPVARTVAIEQRAEELQKCNLSYDEALAQATQEIGGNNGAL